MSKYFRTKAKFAETTDKGLVKLVTKEYLIEASSWTEAEARTYEFLESVIRGEFEIKKVNDTPIENVIIEENSDRFWLVKIKFPSIDDNGKEKFFTTQVAVTADTIQIALERTVEELRKAEVIGFEAVSVTLTKIHEFFPYGESVGVEDQDEDDFDPSDYDFDEL